MRFHTIERYVNMREEINRQTYRRVIRMCVQAVGNRWKRNGKSNSFFCKFNYYYIYIF